MGALQTHLDAAAAHYKAGRVDACIAALRAALAVDPKHGRTHLKLAQRLESRGRAAEAVAAYETFLRCMTAADRKLEDAARERVAALKTRVPPSPAPEARAAAGRRHASRASGPMTARSGRAPQAKGGFGAAQGLALLLLAGLAGTVITLLKPAGDREPPGAIFSPSPPPSTGAVPGVGRPMGREEVPVSRRVAPPASRFPDSPPGDGSLPASPGDAFGKGRVLPRRNYCEEDKARLRVTKIVMREPLRSYSGLLRPEGGEPIDRQHRAIVSGKIVNRGSKVGRVAVVTAITENSVSFQCSAYSTDDRRQADGYGEEFAKSP